MCLKTAIEFVIEPSKEAPDSFDILITRGQYQRYSSNNGATIVVIGQWLGSYIEGAVLRPEDLAKTIDTGTTPEKIMLGGCGQYVLVVIRNDEVSVLSSKNMYPLYWVRDERRKAFAFTSDPKTLRTHLNGKISVNSLEVALQTTFYGGPFETIVNEIKILSWGQKLKLDKAGNIHEAYLSELMEGSNWTTSGLSDDVPYLDPMIAVLSQCDRDIVLLLSGGIDSVVLLLKLREAGVNVTPIVVAQRYGGKFSALNEVVESKQIADSLGISRRLLVADTDTGDVFDEGDRFGWHWGYAYSSAVNGFVESRGKSSVVVNGNGDTLWGIRDSGYCLLNKKMLLHPHQHLRKAWARLLCSDVFLRRSAQQYTNREISTADEAMAPVLNVAMGQFPSGYSLGDTFRNFPDLEEALTARIRQNVLGRLFANRKYSGDIGDLMEAFRVLRFYQYFGGRRDSGTFVTEPYIDALPWYSKTTLGVRECLNGKRDRYRHLRKRTGKRYHSIISYINGDVYKRLPWLKNKYATVGLSELKGCSAVENATFDLTSDRWFHCGRFQELLRNLMTRDICLLDMLERGPVRSYYSRMIDKVRRGAHIYPQKTQPVRLVNFLRLEMFLRDVVG